MAQYRTAQGKVLDMSAFVAKNDRVRAVGNMRVNARGDTIDSDGRVVQSVNDKINEYYSDTVSTPGAMGKGVAPSVPKLSPDTAKPKQLVKPKAAEMSDEERELEESLDQSLEEEIQLERAKQEELNKTRK